MHRSCSFHRDGTAARGSQGRGSAIFGRLGRGLERRVAQSHHRIVADLSAQHSGSYDAALTRPQGSFPLGPRGRRKDAPIAFPTSWSASEVTANRFDWLQGAKEQPTQLLLAALLAVEDVPTQRLPVLLTLLEGRSDLEDCLAAAGLPAVAAAVLRSAMLQRLLPGGAVHETLLGLLEDQAPDLPPGQLLAAARLVAVWHPPTGCEVLAPASASIAAAAADRAFTAAAAGGASINSSGGDDSVAAEAAALAETLALLHPWLSWRTTSGSGEAAAASSDMAAGMWEGADEDVKAEALEVLEGAQAALKALLGLTAVAAAADPALLQPVTSAAELYGVAVQRHLARTAASLASKASSSLRTSTGESSAVASAELAAQLVAQAINARGGSGGGALLNTEEVLALLGARLAPGLDVQQHTAFLRALRMRVRELRQRKQGPGQESGEVFPCRGLVLALASAAGGLGPDALALACECAAAASSLAAADRDELAAAQQQLLSAAAVLVPSCCADQLCRLAAAAVILSRQAGGGADGRAATVSQLLAAAQQMSLREASVEAVAALIAAAVEPLTPVADGDDGMVSSGCVTVDVAMPAALLDTLLRHLAEAASATAAVAKAAASAAGVNRRAAAASAPTTELSYEQAAAVMEVVIAMAEEAVSASASTSRPNSADSAAALPPHRAAVLRAAAAVAAQALTPPVRRLDAGAVTRLLQLVSRSQRAGVRPDYKQLLWAAHERLRVLAFTLPPPAVLDVLRACVPLRWRPSVLLRELLLPLLRRLQAAAAAGGGGDDDDGALTFVRPAAAAAADRSNNSSTGDGTPRGWTAAEVREALVLLAALGYDGSLAASLVKFGVGALLRAHQAATTAGGQQQQQILSAGDLSQLLWVCVSLRYRGAAVLRPLLQLLLQVPASQVSVRAAAQAVWAAARLGVVGERLVRWALSCCQGPGKLAAAPPQSLSNLCWGLAKLGVKPPRAFGSAVAAAALAQLPAFKPQELATTLFMLANWGGRPGGTAGLVRHVLATRAAYDGPALCTAAWALQRLTAPLPPAGIPDDAATVAAASEAEGSAATGVVGGLDSAAMALLEERLLLLLEQRQEAVEGGPRALVGTIGGIADNQLLRFFSACAAAGYRPVALLDAYCAGLLPRLRGLNGCKPTAPAAARRSRLLWSAARVLHTFRKRDPELLMQLECAAERCQGLLGPGQLAGLLGAMAALGHYPGRWVGRGLLRRVGLCLREADVAEAGIILQALATWTQQLADGAVEGAAAKAGQGDRGEGVAQETEEQEGREQINGMAAAADEERAAGEEAGPAGRRQPRARAPTAQRVDLLRRVALARLTQLCVPSPSPPPPPATTASPTTPSPQPPQPQAKGLSLSAAGPAAAGALTAASSSASASASSLAVPTAAAAASDSASASAAAGPRVEVGLDDAMRLLAALARLRWQHNLLEAALVRAAAALPAHTTRRRRVPELTTLLWSLASLRQDTPELLDDLQAALLELPRNQHTMAEEMALLESGRVAGMGGADQAPGAAAAAATASVRAQARGPTAVAADESAVSGPGAEAMVSGSGDDVGSNEQSSAAAASSSGIGVLLRRPAKPAQQLSAGDAANCTAAIDPAAATAAAAAVVNQRLEQQLEGGAGRGRLASEPWSPTDVFKALWACAKMNRHPGPQILAAAERSWLLHTATAQAEAEAAGLEAAAVAPPLHSVTGLLWSLSVFRHHNSAFAQQLAAQLAARVEAGEQAAFDRQALQVAACLLAAQADRSDSPLNVALATEARSQLVETWRARQAQRVASQPNRYQADLLLTLRKMGYAAAANVATPDGCAVVDVAVALTAAPQAPGATTAAVGAAATGPAPARLLALELVGWHNSAANSPRIMGEAVIKYRLLQARGYLVVPVPCYEWDRIGHQDVWTKMVYLQAKIDRRTGTGLAAGAQVPAPAAALGAVGGTAAAGANGNSGSSVIVGSVASV